MRILTRLFEIQLIWCLLITILSVPTLIKTLGSKNEEEVTVARKSLVFNFTSIFERIKNSEKDAKLLGDLLDEGTITRA